MVSPILLFVARGVEVPVIDKRLKTHVNYLEVVQKVDGSAALEEVTPNVDTVEQDSAQ